MTAAATLVELPLLHAQQIMWDSRRHDPDNPKNNCGAYFHLGDGLDRTALKNAVARTYAETEALRVVFRGADEPRQVVLPAESTPWSSVVLRDRTEAVEFMNHALTVPFDLHGEGGLCEHTLIETQDGPFLFFRYDHVTLDAYGGHRYLTRIAQHYNSVVEETPLMPSGFSTLDRLIEEEGAYLDSPRAQQDTAYWLDALSGPTLPRGFSSHTAPSAPRPVRSATPIPPDTRTAFLDWSARSSAKWPAVVAAATACELHRVTGSQDVGIVLLLGNRATRAAVKTPTCMAKELPLPLHVDPRAHFTDLVAAVSRQIAGAVTHQRVPLDRLPATRLGTFVNVIVGEQPRFAGCASRFHVLATGPASDFRLNCYGSAGEKPLLEFEVNPNLYDQEEIDLREKSILDLLHRLVSEPDRELCEVLGTPR